MRITHLTIRNYRALRDVAFRDLTPLTVLCGPNGRNGYATVQRAGDDARVRAMVDAGASLGDLWLEGYLPEAVLCDV